MKAHRRVKIIATLGPASVSLGKIRAFAEQGVNVFRLNMSHGTHAIHAQSIDWIRSVEKELESPLGILVDLQGPKLRIGRFSKDQGIILKEGQSFVLDLQDVPGDETRVSFPHGDLYSHLTVGTVLLLNDGALKVQIEKASPKALETKVLVGGMLSHHKGVNIPGVLLPLQALTPKDREDLAFALEHPIDFVGLSFVQRPEDLKQLRSLVNNKASIFAKIEKPQALESLEEIISLSDGVMVARGDLGVEISLEKVPILQKRIIHLSKSLGKPVIVATQMLETMTEHPFPTRAEASDVATAVYDGADAVMLSAESATGSYPLESIQMMAKIISAVEEDPNYTTLLESMTGTSDHQISDAISLAARHLAKTLDASAIVAYTATGGTARRVSHKRPPCIIFGMTDSIETARRLTLVWGVYPIQIEGVRTFEEMTQEAISRVKSHGGKPGEHLVFTCGIPFGNPGSTNIINVQTVS